MTMNSLFELHLKRKKGFTLIELCIVMVIISIFVSMFDPRYISDEGFQAPAVRAETISTLRAIQQLAMQDTQTIYCVLITKKILGQPDNCNVEGPLTNAEGLLTFNDNWTGDSDTSVIITGNSANYTQSQFFMFDFLGRPVCELSPCPIDIIIEGSPRLTIRIEAEGYIHAVIL
jgi:prepilin-type N-terminal cleavage/methylation domain-containing protein